MLEYKEKRTNAYTLPDDGKIVPGIYLATDTKSKIYLPVGKSRIYMDWKYGFSVTGWSTSLVCPHRDTRADGSIFCTLRRINKKYPVDYSVIKANLAPATKGIAEDSGHSTPFLSGVLGGIIIQESFGEYLVLIKNGEAATFFFSDGKFRVFSQYDEVLEEIILSESEVLWKRIILAHSKLEAVKESLTGTLSILRGMIKIMYRLEMNQEMRLILMNDFFYQLTPDSYALIHIELINSIYQSDRDLINFLEDYPSQEEENIAPGLEKTTHQTSYLH